ncbi:MAG: 30S ribosomal protein S17 [Phycisphaerae bacterium]|mgnify:CR=1 FL=1|nr:30S ribosomal protein S17 [Phycisphaerae bacterium]
MAEVTEQQGKVRRQRRTLTGVVKTAHKTPATLRVEVEFLVRHTRYSKYVRKRTVLHAHDPKAEAKPGDRVEVVECRPVSKTKCWRLAKVVARAAGEAK